MNSFMNVLCCVLLIGMLSSCNTGSPITTDTIPGDSNASQPDAEIPILSMNDWSKDIISDKPGNTRVRYYVLDEAGNPITKLDVYNMTEEHDIDGDGANEILEFFQSESVGIGIYDVISNELNYLDVNQALHCTWSEYTGNMGNLQSEYVNCLEAGYRLQDGTQRSELYRYADGVLTYLCPLEDALRK